MAPRLVSVTICALGVATGIVLILLSHAPGREPGRPPAEPHPDRPRGTGGPPDYTEVIVGLRDQIPKLQDGNRVPGVAIALVDDQTVVWAEGFGFTDRSGKRKV